MIGEHEYTLQHRSMSTSHQPNYHRSLTLEEAGFRSERDLTSDSPPIIFFFFGAVFWYTKSSIRSKSGNWEGWEMLEINGWTSNIIDHIQSKTIIVIHSRSGKFPPIIVNSCRLVYSSQKQPIPGDFSQFWCIAEDDIILQSITANPSHIIVGDQLNTVVEFRHF